MGKESRHASRWNRALHGRCLYSAPCWPPSGLRTDENTNCRSKVLPADCSFRYLCVLLPGRAK